MHEQLFFTEEEKKYILSKITDIEWKNISNSLKLFWIEYRNNQKK